MHLSAHIESLRERRAVLGALLVVMVWLLYVPAIHYDFIRLWDDDAYVTDNPHVNSGLKFTNIEWAFTSFEQSNWHPVTWLSHMLDCTMFGLHPGGHHAVNVLLHAANALLLFWILQAATNAPGRSFFVAALFAVHPLNVETVAWIAQRKSLLSAFFSLFTLAAYGCYVQRGGWRRYLAIVFAFALALMAKPMAVTLPLLLLLFDYWPLGRYEDIPLARRWTRLVMEKLPLFAMSAAASLLTEMAQSSGGSVMTLSLLPFSTRVEDAILACAAYIGKILWPTHLAVYYPLRFSPPLGDVIAAAVVLIVVSGAALYLRRFRYFAVSWFFFLITLIPVIGIVQVGFQGMADRYTYIPAIGIFIACVWGIDAAFAGFPGARPWVTLAGILVITSLGLTTTSYLSFWKSPVALFAQAKNAWGQPDMWLEQLYGNALFSSGRINDALEHYQASCAIQPRTDYCHYNIAHIYSGRRQFPAALTEYRLSLQYTRNPAIAVLCLTESAEVLLQLGEYSAAQQSVSQALRIDPGNAAALALRDQITYQQGARN